MENQESIENWRCSSFPKKGGGGNISQNGINPKKEENKWGKVKKKKVKTTGLMKNKWCRI